MTAKRKPILERTRTCLQLLLDEGFVAWGHDRDRVVLPIQEASVVEFVGRLEPLSLSEVAAACGVLPNTMTGIVDRLVQRGFMVRQRADDDRRIVQVALTDLGREQLEKHAEFLRSFSERLLDRLIPTEREAFVALLEKAASPFFERKQEN